MRSRARHWSRTAFFVALLFGGMAVAARLVLGAWPFDGALELSCVCLVAAVYFRIAAHRHWRALPDPAEQLDRAFSLASSGSVEQAMELLTRVIRQNPQFWQAFQYRGELHLALQEFAEAAADLREAIRLAPEERHLAALLELATGPAAVISDSGTKPESRDSEAR